jgi:hypothetical protein
MQAIDFASALHAKFDKSRRNGHKTRTAADWTRHVFPLLRAIAKERHLWWAGRGKGEVNPRYGEAREYLWDFTMYDRIAGKRPAEMWNLPCVVIEHENAYSLPAFRFDHWKTLFSHAPLRIAIGYVRQTMADRRGEWVQEINDACEANAWHFPPNTEDLIALGHYGMTEGNNNFEFWRRRRGQRSWKKLPVPAARV